MNLKDYSPEKRKFIHSLIFPAFFLFVIWLIKIVEIADGLNLWHLGIYPRRWSGLLGILFAPLIHGSFNHLIDNSVSFLFLSLALFYFYNLVAYRVFFFTYLFTGIMVWIFGRESYHIGASGLIYGFGSFLFFSGIIKQNIHLLAISLLVTFLYGSMVWGILPYIQEISWESHLSGALAGFLLSIYYRNEGPPIVKKEYPDEEDEEEEKDAYWKVGDANTP